MSESELFDGTRMDAIDRLETKLAKLRKAMLIEAIARLSMIDEDEHALDMARKIVSGL